MARTCRLRCHVQRTFFIVALILGFGFGFGFNTYPSWGAGASELEDGRSSESRSMLLESESEVIKPPGTVKFFQLSDGDYVACVNIQDQLSKPVNVQLTHSRQPPTTNSTTSTVRRAAHTYTTDLTTREGSMCPSGTIPTRVRPKDQIPAAANHFRKHRRGKAGDPAFTGFPGHEHVTARLDGVNFKGMQASINLWAPYVENGDFSLAQIWLVGVDANQNINTMEAGWQVSKAFYGDLRPRFFIYWTRDNYVNTGCYNLECDGFVQVGNKVLVGGSFTRTSIPGSTQYEIKLTIFKDPGTGNWWLQLNDENVGYWPASLFNILRNSANRLDWGGEIYTPSTAARHTGTDMGSGAFASAGYARAAYQRKLQYVDTNLRLHDALGVTGLLEAPGCYTYSGGYSASWGQYFYFGGPGYNAQSCI